MTVSTKPRKKQKPRKDIMKFSDEDITKMETLAEVLSREQIAQYFGVSKTTFFEMLKRQPEAAAACDTGKAKAINEVGQQLLTKARAGHVGAICFYLKTQAGWRETDRVDVNHGGDVKFTILTGVPRPDED